MYCRNFKSKEKLKTRENTIKYLTKIYVMKIDKPPVLKDKQNSNLYLFNGNLKMVLLSGLSSKCRFRDPTGPFLHCDFK